jgi:RecA-family ATPase
MTEGGLVPDRDQLGTDVRPTTRKVISASVLEQRRAAEKLANMVNDALATNQPVSKAAFDALRAAFTTGGEELPKALRAPLRSILDSGEDWFGAPPARREYLFRRDGAGAFPRSEVGLMAGPGGRGKSWLNCQLALSVATGRPWLDTFEITRPGRVLLALGEEKNEELRRRIHYAARTMELTPEELADAAANIVPMGLHGEHVNLIEGEGRDVSTTAVFRAFERRLAEGEFALLIFDPLSRFAPDAESNNAAVTMAVQAFESLTMGPGNPSVLLCHHSNKQSRADGSKGGANMVRGVTGLTDAVRWECQLTGSTEDDLALHFSKGNYGPAAEDLALERRQGEHGFIRAIDPELRAELRAEAIRDESRELRKQIRMAAVKKPGLTKNQLMSYVGGRKARVRDAIEVMLIDGELANEGTDKRWKLVAS